jgi:hypothetical protein
MNLHRGSLGSSSVPLSVLRAGTCKIVRSAVFGSVTHWCAWVTASYLLRTKGGKSLLYGDEKAPPDGWGCGVTMGERVTSLARLACRTAR